MPCVGIKAIVDVIAADRGCREHIRAALLQRQRGELLEPPIANPFPVRPMPAKPLADLPDVSDDATALSHADVAALVAARLSEGEAPQHDAPQLEGAFQRAKDGTGVGQAVPSPAPVAAPSAAAIAAVPAAPAAVSVAPCEAPQRRKGLL